MTREDEIRKRLEAATPGPWERIGDDLGCKKVAANVMRDEDGEVFSCDAIGWTPGLYDENADEANAQLIANAPSDLRYLLEKVERLEAEIYKCHVDHDEFGPCECETCERVRSKKEPTA